MDGLDDFMLYNACEDAREEAHQTTEYPHQSQFWEDDDKGSSGYWDDDSTSSDEG